MEEYKTSWSDDGQIFFLDNHGWGVDEDGRTIVLGEESDIKHFLKTGEVKGTLNPLQVRVLMQIREEFYGNTGATDMERVGGDGTSRSQPKTTRLFKTRKRTPLRALRTKSKGVSGR